MLKVACGVGLVGWLLWQAAGHEAFDRLAGSRPRVGALVTSWAAIVTALAFAFSRWRLVAAAAGIPMSLAEAMRLGAIGFALNFVALGSIGGDVAKAALLAKPRPGSRAAAVTTVVVDRLFGLLGFLLFASAAILATGTAGEATEPALRVLSRSTLTATAICVAVFVTPLATPPAWRRWFVRLTGGVPLLGPAVERAADLATTYQSGAASLLGALALGLVANGAFIYSFYAAAMALPLAAPSLTAHLQIVPLAMIAGALPISPNGLGTIEATAEYLYRTLEPSTSVGDGTFVAITHRLVMLAVGVAAVVYSYASGGRRLAESVEPINTASPISDDGSGTAVADANASRQSV